MKITRMRERELIMSEADATPYWSEDVLLGEASFAGERSLVRLKLHTSEEPFGSRNAAELVPLTYSPGVAVYLHGQPYLVEPAISLAVNRSQTPEDGCAIGRITETAWKGMRHRSLGNAQAWYYPRDRLILLWECFLEDRYRQANPVTDPLLASIWTGFETLLRTRFPAAQRLVTPSWEDLYEKVEWQQFLGAHGYIATSTSAGAFCKLLTNEE